MVPKTGLEPVQYRYRRILSPLRLPISPLGQLPIAIINNLNNKINSKFKIIICILKKIKKYIKFTKIVLTNYAK